MNMNIFFSHFHSKGILSLTIVLHSLLLYLCSTSIYAENINPLSLSLSLSEQSLTEHLQIAIDPQQQWTIDGLLQKTVQADFQTSHTSMPNLGLSSAAIWLRFQINNPRNTDQIRLLEISYPLLDYIELYQVDAQGHYKLKQAGDRYAFSQRDIKHPNFIFKLTFPAHQTQFIYLRVRTAGSVSIPLTFWHPISFVEYTRHDALLAGIYFGVMIAMFLSNLFLFLLIRERSYFYYTLFIAVFGLSLFTMKGYAFQYLWPDQILWANRSVLLLFCLSVMFMVQFSRHFLNLSVLYRRIDTALQILVAFILVACFAVLFMDYADATHLTALVGAFTFVLFPIGILCLRHGQRSAYYYVLAWTIIPISALLFGLENLGLLALGTMGLWSLQLGSAIGVIVLSLGLGDKIRQMKIKEKRFKHDMAATEAMAQAKSEFLATMSHEIRTPMNGVIGMTSLLADTELSREQHEFVETIRSSGESLLTIINDILDYSRIDAGKMTLENQAFNLRLCIEDVLDLLAAQASEKDLELIYQFDPQVPESIVADATRLRQILTNLVGNAIKFTSQGEVLVKISQLDNPRGLTLLFEVEDTGIGIPPERIHRLFKPFSQVDSSINRRFGGTGLGLAICARLVAAMGGSIQVESHIGQGSRFYFSIETLMADTLSSDSQHIKLVLLRNKRVLIVDDNKTNRHILSLQCKHWGIDSLAVESGSAALSCLQRGEKFDFGIIDMQMPGMDGLMLGARIRRRYSHTQLPLIMLSSIGKPDIPEDLPEHIFSVYLSKPVRQSQLLDTIVQVFDETQSLLSKPRSQRHQKHKIDHKLAYHLPLRILLAEDNRVNQRLAQLVLNKMGYQIDIAANGIEALQAVSRQDYDVIFMDVQMPEMDGLTATRKIIADYPAEKRPVIIAMTANAMQGDKEMCLEAGMDDYITKPIKTNIIETALKTWGKKHVSNG